MDLNELNSIDINNPEQVKRVQEFLKKQGYYSRKVDGNWGEGTAAARKAFSDAEADRQAREAKEADAKAKRDEEAKDRQAVRDREAAEAKSKRDKEEADAKAVRDAEAAEKQRLRDVETGKILAGSTVAGLSAGLLGGKLADALGNKAIVKEMKARDAQLKPLAASSRAIDPNAPNARLLHKDIANVADTQGLTRKPVPWGTGATGLALGGFGAYSTFGRAPEAKSDVEAAIWKGSGYGEMSAAAKMLADSLRRYKNPGHAYSAGDLNAIESSKRIAAGGPVTAVAPPGDAPPYTPPAAPPPPPGGGQTPPPPPSGPLRHSQRLVDAVTAAGAGAAKSKSANYNALSRSLTAENLPSVAKALNLPANSDRRSVLQRARELVNTKGASSIALPLAFGALAAGTGDAEAADASLGDRATNAAGNFAVGAGGAYAGSKLVDALSRIAPTAMKAAGGGLMMLNPSAAVDMTDGLADLDPQKIKEHDNEILNSAVQSWPFNTELVRGLSKQHSDAYDIAQVPPTNPERRSMGPRLEDAGIQNRLRRMQANQATPDQIAAFLNSAFAP